MTSVCENAVNIDECYIDQIKTALIEFNTAFSCYQGGCANGCSTSISCDYATVVKPAYDRLMAVIQETIDHTSPLPLPTDGGDGDVKQMQTTLADIHQLREDINGKLTKLNLIRGGSSESPYYSYKVRYDYQEYLPVLYVVLATSVMFFGFLQM
jgi:hypothetical protein